MRMQKIAWVAFSVWCQVVAAFAQEVTVSDASIILKTVTVETQTSTIDGVELASTTREVSAIESTQKVKRLDIDSESEKISVIVIPKATLQKVDNNSILLIGKTGVYNVVIAVDGILQVVEVTIGNQPQPPGPAPGPAPIPELGLRVLVLYETAEVSAWPAKQSMILRAAAVRDWLNANCVKGSDGRAVWRFVDDDVEWTDESPLSIASRRPRASSPWVIVSNGKDGYEGPLPATQEDFLSLVKKYAPVQKVAKVMQWMQICEPGKACRWELMEVQP